MILLKDLREYCGTLRDRVDGINYFGTVLDEGEISRTINKRGDGDNALLYLVVPEASGMGSSESNLRARPRLTLYSWKRPSTKRGTRNILRYLSVSSQLPLNWAG